MAKYMKKFTILHWTTRALAASLLLVGTQAFALECAPGQWLAEYFPNTKLAGNAVLERCESGPIDYYWMTDSPAPKLPVDGFSARWTASLPFAGGAAKFTTYTDDGVRVFVDGKRIINNWTVHGITMDAASVRLSEGLHTVRMEYFEAGGEGLAQLFIDGSAPTTPPPQPPRIQAFTAQPDVIEAGNSSILSWSTENATACTATGGWSGEQAGTGGASVRPTVTTTYGLSCRNAAGSTTAASATVTVRKTQQPPTIGSFSATPTRIMAGQSAQLAWQAHNATTCTASGGWSGPRAAEGNELVRPAANAAYTLTCTNTAGQSVAATTQVAVEATNPLPPVGGVTAARTSGGVSVGWNPAAQSGKWVNGYYAGWFWEAYPPEAVDMGTMTHFVFGRYAPALGSLPGGRAGDLLEGAGSGHLANVEDALIAKAHAAGAKAVMMVGGDSDGPGFVAATANATVRARFIKNVLDKAVQKNYDGVDIDWEENLDTAATRAQALALLRELRAASALRARYQAPNAPLELSWPGFWVNKNDPDITPWHAEVAATVDRFNLMTYSMAGDWGWQSWHHSPLSGAGDLYPTSIESTVQAYLDMGIARSKLGIGIGLYGAYYNSPVTGPRQSMDGMQGWMNNGDWENNYQRLVNDNAFNRMGATYHWDDVAKQGYMTYSPPWNRGTNTPVTYLSFEDERSIAEKGKWVREQGLGGTLVWTINYGYLPQSNSNPQMQAVKQAFIADSATRYRIYRDGVVIATVTGLSYTDVTPPLGSHYYQVSVLDAAGNEGPQSAPVTVQLP